MIIGQRLSPLRIGRDIGIALALFAVTLALYVRTLAPGLLPGDSGEFQVLAYQVGIAHTTGYPVYMVLAKLFTLAVPIRDIAYRVNLFSAFSASLTVALVYGVSVVLTGSRWAASSGALALAVSHTFWSQALIAEVYAPAAACLALVLLLVLTWHRCRDPRPLFLAGAVGGLGLGVHASVGLLGLAVAALLAIDARRWRSWAWPALSGALLGVALYLGVFAAVDLRQAPANIFNAAYGPSRSFWDLSEADLANPLKRMWFIGTAGQWRSAAFADPDRLMPARAADFARGLPQEFPPVILALIVLGWIGLARRERQLALFWLIALAIQLGFYFNYDAWDIYVFYIPAYVMMAILASAGAREVLQWAQRLPVGASATAIVGAGLIAVALWPQLSPRWGDVTAGRVPFAGERAYPYDGNAAWLHDAARAVVASLEPGAIVFTDWYWLYPYYYVAHVEMGRLDLWFIETAPRNDRGGLAASVVAMVEEQIGQRPIYFSRRWQELERAGFRLRPVRLGGANFFRVEPG